MDLKKYSGANKESPNVEMDMRSIDKELQDKEISLK
jgi:hypothetical protein